MILVVVAGLVVGSFLNVVVSRVPEGRSLWGPRSACPACGATIAWHDNIPLLSFAALHGRCRHCAVAISWRYPIVEAATPALFAAAWAAFGPSRDFALAALLLALLVAITAIDVERHIIPDRLTIPGTLAGFLANVATGRVGWLDSALGIALGGGLFFAIILARPDGMGGGDMKLGAMLGAFLGWKIALLAIFVAVMLGGALAVVLMAAGVRGSKDPIPFGPFLALGGAAGLFWGEGVIRWYLAGFAA